MAKGTLVYTKEEVARHNTEKDCWIVIGRAGDKKVYDFTPFLNAHPGGPELVLTMAGQDVNEMFEDIGHTTDALAQMEKYCIGTLKEEPQVVSAEKIVAGGAGGDNVFYYVCFLVIASAMYYHLNKATEETFH